MSLRLRIALVVAAVVAVVVVAVGVTLHRSTEAALVDEIDGDLLQRVAPALGPGEPRRDRFPIDRFRDLTQRDNFLAPTRTDPFAEAVGFDALARVIDGRGDIRGVLAGEFDAPTDPALLAAVTEGPVIVDGTVDGARARVVTFRLTENAYVQIARPLDEVESVLSSLRRRTALIGGIAIAAAAVAYHRLRHRGRSRSSTRHCRTPTPWCRSRTPRSSP